MLGNGQLPMDAVVPATVNRIAPTDYKQRDMDTGMSGQSWTLAIAVGTNTELCGKKLVAERSCAKKNAVRAFSGRIYGVLAVRRGFAGE